MDVVVFATVGLIVGWYACKAWIAHADVGGTVKKIIGLKRARSHNGGIALLVFIVALVVLYGLTTHHK
jgi:hypothetical protein